MPTGVLADPLTVMQNSTDNTASTASVQTYSNATTVPAVISVATLSNYGSVADFNSSERDRVCHRLLFM